MLQRILGGIIPQKKISDADWFALQFDPAKARDMYRIRLPGIPSDDTQKGYTALSGENNLRQAFEFYLQMRKVCQLDTLKRPKVLDFGGGWGRVSRLFLRDTAPRNIYLAETRASTIQLLKDLKVPYTVIHNAPPPPIAGLPNNLDLVFAYSVFSHLSEQYFLDWMAYFLKVLKPGGHVVFTSRGHYFIRHLQHLHASEKAADPMLAEHIRRLKQMMPHPDEILRLYDAGQFQFYPIGGSEELIPSFFGETFIPEAYLKKHFGATLISFSEDVPRVDQSITVLRKR
ncbi:MAG: class I SAM-dependent methyltransferase [Hyphomicrobiales bacterium]|nr:MAG: class I SAM-dependent methyltransferase [Hyphomicrobiales bacterium]